MTFLTDSATPQQFLASDAARTTLIRVIHVAFPHDRVPEVAYERTADSLLTLAATTTRMALAVSAGLQSLRELPGGDFLELNDDDASAELQRIEKTDFFVFVRGNTVLTLYNAPDTWSALGWEGSSVEHGGYLERGFNDLAWLPDPRVEEYTGDLVFTEVGELPYLVGAAESGDPVIERDEVTK